MSKSSVLTVMHQRLSLRATSALLILLFVGFPLSACGQPSVDADRSARIISNIKYSIAQLADAPLSITSLEAGEKGFDKGVINIAGQQDVSFLVSKDDTQLYLLATEAIDASRSEADIAALKAAEERSKGSEAIKRGAMLLEASAGLPERGNPDASITIVEFSDFQCPYCAKATSTIEEVMKEFGNEVRLVYMHLPLESIHPWAMNAAVAASCAAEQDDDAFWTLHDFYFENQGSIDGNNLISKSSNALGGSEINMTEFATCLDSKSAKTTVSEHLKIGQGLGLSGTPAFFVNGRMINGAQPIDHFREAIQLAKMDIVDKG